MKIQQGAFLACIPARNNGTSEGDWQNRGYQPGQPGWRADYSHDKLLIHWTSVTYIWCLLPQLVWCMPLPVMFSFAHHLLTLIRPLITSCVDFTLFCPLPMLAHTCYCCTVDASMIKQAL